MEMAFCTCCSAHGSVTCGESREPVSGQEDDPERWAMEAAWGGGGGLAHLHDDQFGGQVVGGAQLLAETQRDAALRRLAAAGVEVLQLCSARAGGKIFSLTKLFFFFKLFHESFCMCAILSSGRSKT